MERMLPPAINTAPGMKREKIKQIQPRQKNMCTAKSRKCTSEDERNKKAKQKQTPKMKEDVVMNWTNDRRIREDKKKDVGKGRKQRAVEFSWCSTQEKK